MLFFLSLCGFLLNGEYTAYGMKHVSSSIISSNVHYKSKSTSVLKDSGNGFNLVKHNKFGEQKEDYLSMEDDDDDLVFARKYVVLVKYLITIAYTSLLLLFFDHLKNRLPFCRHTPFTFSHKYILQRTLRI